MPRFLVKLFSPSSQYTYVEAATPLEAAQKFTGRKLKIQPPGDEVALVQMVVDKVVTTVAFYADDKRVRAKASAELSKSAREAVVAWCDRERDRLLKEIDEVEKGGMIVQRITAKGPVDMTVEFLASRKRQLADLDDVATSVKTAP